MGNDVLRSSRTPSVKAGNIPGDKLKFLELNQDILLVVLSFCGILGVISASQTCKHLQSLALSRYVWLSLVLDLQARMLLDVPPSQNLRELSTLELVNLAKHTVLGPSSWSRPYSLEGAISRRSLVNPLQPNQEILSAELLLGGQYVAIISQHVDESSEVEVVVTQYGKLFIWNVSKNALVWQYNSPERSEPRMHRYSVDMLDYGRSARILIVEPVVNSDHSESQTLLADIVQVDLVTGTSSSLFKSVLGDAHPSNVDDASFLAIRGDIAVVKSARTIFLINWKTQSCVTLNADVSYDRMVALTYDHLIQVTPLTDTDPPKIIIWNIDAFTTLWSPANEPDTWHSGSIKDVPPLVSELLSFPSFSRTMRISLTVHESPLYEGLYQVSIVSLALGKITLLRYSLSTSRVSLSDRPWRLKSSRTTDGGDFFASSPPIAYAGNVSTWVSDMVVLNLRDWTGQGNDAAPVGLGEELDEDEAYTTIDVLDYSGAVMCSTNRSVVIRYYR